MKLEDIKFSQEASKRVYNNYMKRVKKATSSLSKTNQDDIYMEFNSHIFEAMRNKSGANEIDILLDILDKLGIPEEILKPLVADKKLEQATKTFNPIHVFKALVLNFTNGITYIIFSILYLFLFALVFLIFAKIAYPGNVGLYYRDASFLVLGISGKAKENGVSELLGNWFIPVMLILIVVFYVLITFLLKFIKTVNQK